MNVLDGYVSKVLSEPYQKYGRWAVDVEYECWGSTSKTTLFFSGPGAASDCKVGYHFLC